MANWLMTAQKRPQLDLTAPAGFDVRPLAQPELAAVADLYHSTYVGSVDEMSREQARAEISASWRGDYGEWVSEASLGAWHRHQLVGAVLVTVDPPWPDTPRGPFIIDLFIRPDARRQGLGRALVATAWARVGSGISLRVDDSAPAAKALYESMGFVVS